MLYRAPVDTSPATGHEGITLFKYQLLLLLLLLLVYRNNYSLTQLPDA